MSSETSKTTGIVDSSHSRHTCIGCRIKFESADLQRCHFKTEWHSYNLKRKICHLGPIDLDSFNQIQASLHGGKQDAKTTTRPNHKTTRDEGDKDSEGDWEEVQDEDLLDEDYDEDEAAELLARVIKFDTCLFCDKKSSTIKSNVQHMNLMHGFFVPEDRYLIDLEGLLEYLGFKVGAGLTCLWCNKQFATLHGVRLHMICKDHCKIMYDQEKATEEFKEFYDYSTQERFEMKPLNQLAIPKRRIIRQTEYQGSRGTNLSFVNQTKHLETRKNLPTLYSSCQAKGIKRFNARRAKVALRTAMSSNYTMRGRLRQQNPI